MKNWEFLIQQAGDRHWHSLDANLGSLTTGNYRLVARTPYANHALAIKLTYQETTDSPENCRDIELQESRQTNGEGLVMIFPYRDLSAGYWQLSFTSQGFDGLSDNGGDAWEQAIAFQVSDRLPTVEESLDKEPEINLINPIYQLPLPDLFLEELADNLDVSLSQAKAHKAIVPALFPVAITLDRNEFGEMGESFLLLAGQVEAASSLDRPLLVPARLRYRLQDLDSAAYILDEPKSWLPILGEVLPFTFQETLVLPPTEAKDLLGEVLIETETGEPLAQVLFNLTLSHGEAIEEESVNYTIQLSNLENKSSFTFEVIVPKAAAETPLNVDLPNPAKMNRLLKRSLLPDRQVLPPKIRPILTQSTSKKSLQLPKISPF